MQTVESNSTPLKTANKKKRENYFLVLLKSQEGIWIWAVMDPEPQIMVQNYISTSLVVSIACFLLGFILGQVIHPATFYAFINPAYDSTSFWLAQSELINVATAARIRNFSHSPPGSRFEVYHLQGYDIRIERDWYSRERLGVQNTYLQHRFNMMLTFQLHSSSYSHIVLMQCLGCCYCNTYHIM